MTALPPEILRLISQSLVASELLQFQIVNKSWHEASRESLYSRVEIRNERDALTCIRTISNCRKTGSYVKSIYVRDIFNENNNSEIWDKHNLFDTLAKYCFNLRSIVVFNPHNMLWMRLMHAATQGQFPNLQILPDVSDEALDYYVYTALAFRKSLTRLELRDHVQTPYMSMPLLNIRAFQELRSRIKEFLNLKTISMKYYSTQPFSDIVDSLIDDCPHLITLIVKIHMDDTLLNNLQASKRQDVVAIPKPNISSLTCDWWLIFEDDQLKYVMQKFPNLRQLRISNFYFGDQLKVWEEKTSNTSYYVMMKFMKYISNINEINISFSCKQKDIVNYWSEFKKLRKLEMLEKLSICYEIRRDNSNAIMSYSKKELGLTYTIGNFDQVIPYEEFLCEHGNRIKQVSIDYTRSTHDELRKASPLRYILSSENWIYHILQLCPTLQHLKLVDLVEFKLPSNSTYQHTELKKLEIVDNDNITPLTFLRGFSLHVPNLKILKIFSFRKNNNGYCVEIDMPYTKFNLISVKFEENARKIEDYFIKLNTIVDERYYSINCFGRRTLTHDAYQKSNKQCVFNITCSELKQFHLKRDNAHEDKDNELISRQTF